MTEVQSTQHESSRIPSPPPFALSTDLTDDETDVDLGDADEDDDQDHDQGDDDDDRLAAATVPEGVEYLGSYRSVVDYLRAMLEPEINASIHWIFDTLDWDEVLARFEADGSRYFCEGGHVFRTHLPLQPEPDPTGPWMSTRGQ